MTNVGALHRLIHVVIDPRPQFFLDPRGDHRCRTADADPPHGRGGVVMFGTGHAAVHDVAHDGNGDVVEPAELFLMVNISSRACVSVVETCHLVLINALEPCGLREPARRSGVADDDDVAFHAHISSHSGASRLLTTLVSMGRY